MVSESNKAINVFSNSTSSSRLSPLARPFTVNTHFSNRQESFDPLLNSSSSSSSTSSTSRLDQTYLSLGGQAHLHGYYAYLSDATSIAALPCIDDSDFQPSSRFAYNPLEKPPLANCFSLPAHQFSQTSFISSSPRLGNVGHNIGVQGIAVDQQGSEILRNNDQSGSASSLSFNSLLEQGTTVEGSKLFSVESSVFHGKGIEVRGKDNRIRPEDKEKIHTESGILPMTNSELNLNKCMEEPFSTSPALSSSPRPEGTQNQLSYTGPLITWSQCDPAIFPNERYLPHLRSCGAETLVSHALEYFSYSAQVFQPASASSSPLIVNPFPLQNVASVGSDAVSNKKSYCGDVLPSMMDTYMVQNPVSKVAFHDQVTIEKDENRKIVEPVHHETKYPSIRMESMLEIACPNVSKDLSLEQHSSKAGMPDDKSSTNHDDSDVDSPCWKGTQAYKSPLRDSVAGNSEDSRGQSPSRVSVPLKSEHSKNERVARNSLNPLAPVFIPGNSKQTMDYHRKECHGDRSLSSQKIAPLSVTSSSREHTLRESVEAGTCASEKINDTEIQPSSDAYDSKKEYGVSYKPFRSSTVNSSCSFEPRLRGDYITSDSQLGSGTNVTGSMECSAAAAHNGLDRVDDIAWNGPNTSFSLLTTKSHSIGVDVFSDFTKRLQKSIKSMPPEIDVKLLIHTIEYLSELLRQNSSFDFGSLSEHENDKLLNIINNLNVLRSKAGQMAARPNSCHPCTSCGCRQPADRDEVTTVKDEVILHDREIDKMSAPMLSSRVLYSFYQSNNEGFEKVNDIRQVIKKDPKLIHSMAKEMPAQALFYRNLWLEAKAALHFMEYIKCMPCT